MKRRDILKGATVTTMIPLVGISTAAVDEMGLDDGSLSPNDMKAECDGYRYCENCLELSNCDEDDCSYVCN